MTENNVQIAQITLKAGRNGRNVFQKELVVSMAKPRAARSGNNDDRHGTVIVV